METVRIVRGDGLVGTIVERTVARDGTPQMVVAFADGARLTVPPAALVAQSDGTYRLIETAVEAQAEEVVIPVIAEELSVSRRRVVRGRVRVHKRVEAHEQVVDEPTIREEVTVERVAINKLVEGDPPEPREEDGVLIIPVLEEVLVVEKRLVLREELRVGRRRTTISNPQTVVLRREVVEIERIAGDEPAAGEAHG